MRLPPAYISIASPAPIIGLAYAPEAPVVGNNHIRSQNAGLWTNFTEASEYHGHMPFRTVIQDSKGASKTASKSVMHG